MCESVESVFTVFWIPNINPFVLGFFSELLFVLVVSNLVHVLAFCRKIKV
jgi:hypothetical protein